MKDDILRIDDMIKSKINHMAGDENKKHFQLMDINHLLYLDFNVKYIERDILHDDHIEFIADMFVSQTSPNKQHITCSCDSNHLLFPRIDSEGDKCLVCMDCGYVRKI